MLKDKLLTTESSYETLNTEEAIKYILEIFPVRKKWDEVVLLIRKKAEERNISEDELHRMLNQEVTRQNYWNWKRGTNISRDSAIRIALALGLNVEETNSFLTNGCWHDSLYYRDYRDLIFIYCINKKKDWKYAIKLISNYSELDNPNAIGITDNSVMNGLTKLLYEEFCNYVTDEQTLREFLEKNQNLFGSYRREAYRIFKEIYDELYETEGNNMVYYFKDEEMEVVNDINNLSVDSTINKRGHQYFRNSVSIEHICKTILMGLRQPRKRNNKSDEWNNILKLITKNIPNKTDMNLVLNGKKPVPRKYIILSWLVNVNDVITAEDITDDTNKFYECISQLNEDYLECSGMHHLDYSNPFDWLIANALLVACFRCESKERIDAIERICDFSDMIMGE